MQTSTTVYIYRPSDVDQVTVVGHDTHVRVGFGDDAAVVAYDWETLDRLVDVFREARDRLPSAEVEVREVPA